jgi:hypothetical protein
MSRTGQNADAPNNVSSNNNLLVSCPLPTKPSTFRENNSDDLENNSDDLESDSHNAKTDFVSLET